jgi:hypothetical protein
VVKEGFDPKTICLRGFEFDKIKKCHFLGDRITRTPAEQLVPTLMEIIAQWDPDPEFAAAEEQGAEALYKTLSADVGPTSTRLKDEVRVLRFPKARDWLQLHDLDEDMDPTAAVETAQHIYFELMGRDVFVTDNGYLVLGPRDARVNDLVCVLLGGQVPFVLRLESGTFRLLGEGYVHGIMDGEAMGIVGEEAYEDFSLV